VVRVRVVVVVVEVGAAVVVVDVVVVGATVVLPETVGSVVSRSGPVRRSPAAGAPAHPAVTTSAAMISSTVERTGPLYGVRHGRGGQPRRPHELG
jgi:hypothetical protein